MSAPKYGGGGVKCKKCDKTVYQSELTTYDGQSFHNTCFKCLECKNVVNLTAVAMIKGDLYCKTCFKRIFMKEGKYSSFDNKEGGDRSRANTADQSNAPPATPPATTATAAAVAPAPSGERRASVVLPCVVADCKGARVPRKNYCLDHLNAGADQTPAAFNDLLDAIEKKNVDKVKEILAAEKSAEILFKLDGKGVGPIEKAFSGVQNSRACGEAMLAWLQSKVAALEKQ